MKIRTTEQAVEFIHGTFYYAGLNLNPDLGFLKANNTTAFPKLTDAGAQKAQAHLVEAEEVLRKDNIDIWEVCMEMSIYITTHKFCQAALAGTAMESEEWLGFIENYHNGFATLRECRWPLDDEPDSEKRKRRATFIFDTIENLHRQHPSIAQNVPNSWDLGNGQRASFLCVSLLPPNWKQKIDEIMGVLGGGQVKQEFQLGFEGAEQFQNVVDEITEEYGEIDLENFDDDPLSGLDW